MKTRESQFAGQKARPVELNSGRVFSGIYPCGVVYADRMVQQAGDYKRLAFLPYRSLELEIERDCPPDLAEEIRLAAAPIQERRGGEFQISACGQTVVLGR
jgi:hypothetical protein